MEVVIEFNKIYISRRNFQLHIFVVFFLLFIPYLLSQLFKEFRRFDDKVVPWQPHVTPTFIIMSYYSTIKATSPTDAILILVL